MSDVATLRELLHHAVDAGCDVLERIERRGVRAPTRTTIHDVNDVDVAAAKRVLERGGWQSKKAGGSR